MKTIYVLYDSRCGLCSRARSWMLAQPAHLAIEFVAAGSEIAKERFPQLRHSAMPTQLVVVDDRGGVYYGDSAWIVCLYALTEYRSWSYRLVRPPLRHLARRAWELFSSNRQQISETLALKSDAEVARELQSQPESVCEVQGPP
jgi:predicted DCC family thiol-disulfide oxidoreductase YuxK